MRYIELKAISIQNHYGCQSDKFHSNVCDKNNGNFINLDLVKVVSSYTSKSEI